MSWLCRVGWHRWDFVSVRDAGEDDVYVTYCCCVRGNCPRFADWFVVHREKSG